MNLLFFQVFCAIFSGASEAASIANELLPAGSPFSALVCLAPLYCALYTAKSYRSSFLIFFLQTLTVHLASSWWLAHFHGFAFFTLGASAAGTAFQGGLCGILAFAFPHEISAEQKLAERAGIRQGDMIRRMMWFSAVWIGYEYIKSTGALGYPWGTVFMAAYKWSALTQIADITGTWGITFLFALSSSACAEGILLFQSALSGPERKKAADRYCRAVKFTAAAFAVCILYGAVQLSISRTPEKHFSAVLVQQNADPWKSGDRQAIAVSKELTESGTRELEHSGYKPDLVVWSEGVLSRSFPAAQDYYSRFPEDESLRSFIQKTGAPFLIGGTVTIDSVRRKRANSAILFDRNGTYCGFYSKIQLVPFAEKIPYAGHPVMKALMEKTAGLSSSLSSGFQYVLFKIPIRENQWLPAPLDSGQPEHAQISLDSAGIVPETERERYVFSTKEHPLSFVKFTVPICFEDAFPSVCSRLYSMGSEVFLNITNDSWSKTKSAELQHFIVSSFLAIEYRTTLARCANSGYTAVVNPAGTVIFSLPLFTEASAGIRIPVYGRKTTVYSVYGDWLAKSMILLVLLYILYAYFKRFHFEKNSFIARCKSLRNCLVRGSDISGRT